MFGAAGLRRKQAFGITVFMLVVVMLYGYLNKAPVFTQSGTKTKPEPGLFSKVDVKKGRKKKNILVTGAAGFIGFHLCKRLRARGDLVVGYDNLSELKGPIDASLKKARKKLLASNGIDVVHGDICNRDMLKQVIETHKITHVVNLAAEAGVRASVSNPNQYVASNVDCFVHLLEVLRHYPDIRLTYASSSSVYGTNTKVPFSVTDRVDNPASVYAATKKENELLAHVYHHQYHLRSAGLRFFTVYGPYGRADMAYFGFTKAILEGREVPVFSKGEFRRDFTFIEDLIPGVMAVIDLGADFEIFNLGNNKPVTVLELVGAIEKATGKKANIRYTPPQLGDVEITYADIDYSTQMFGYQPHTTIEVGIKIFVEWYLSHYK